MHTLGAMPTSSISNDHMTKKTIIITLASLLALLFISWFIWPTPYQYSEMKLSNNVYPVRINRITGSTEMLLPSGWIRLGSGKEPNVKTSGPIPNADLSKLDASGRISSSSFIADIYNGTDWVITNLEIQLTVKNRDGSTRFYRRYKIWCTKADNRGEPLTSSTYSCDLGEFLGGYYDPIKFEWNILAANGFKD